MFLDPEFLLLMAALPSGRGDSSLLRWRANGASSPPARGRAPGWDGAAREEAHSGSSRGGVVSWICTIKGQVRKREE